MGNDSSKHNHKSGQSSHSQTTSQMGALKRSTSSTLRKTRLALYNVRDGGVGSEVNRLPDVHRPTPVELMDVVGDPSSSTKKLTKRRPPTPSKKLLLATLAVAVGISEIFDLSSNAAWQVSQGVEEFLPHQGPLPTDAFPGELFFAIGVARTISSILQLTNALRKGKTPVIEVLGLLGSLYNLIIGALTFFSIISGALTPLAISSCFLLDAINESIEILDHYINERHHKKTCVEILNAMEKMAGADFKTHAITLLNEKQKLHKSRAYLKFSSKNQYSLLQDPADFKYEHLNLTGKYCTNQAVQLAKFNHWNGISQNPDKTGVKNCTSTIAVSADFDQWVEDIKRTDKKWLAAKQQYQTSKEIYALAAVQNTRLAAEGITALHDTIKKLTSIEKPPPNLWLANETTVHWTKDKWQSLSLDLFFNTRKGRERRQRIIYMSVNLSCEILGIISTALMFTLSNVPSINMIALSAAGVLTAALFTMYCINCVRRHYRQARDIELAEVLLFNKEPETTEEEGQTLKQLEYATRLSDYEMRHTDDRDEYSDSDSDYQKNLI